MSEVKVDDLCITLKVESEDAVSKLERIKELLTEINQLKDEIFGKQLD